MSEAYRTIDCAALRPEHAGHAVRVAGWVHSRRDHGGVYFFDLRDRSGVVQVVARPEAPEAFKAASLLGPEFVVSVAGVVQRRPAGSENSKIPTGEIELAATGIRVLNPSKPLPFEIDERSAVGEETRLKYRFLDLRRRRMLENMTIRHKVAAAARRTLDAEGFIEVETPMLTKATPEGARDFLVPSRLSPGAFYALPQSPQIFKQILMVSGLDRYYQFARAFRDEDLRSDRQPEHTQIDVEMSFVEEADVHSLVEKLIVSACRAAGVELKAPFPRLDYEEAMRRYGSDKPDLRNPIVMQNVSDHFRGSGFKIFARLLESEKNEVWAIPAPTGGQRTFADRMNSWAQGEGQPGLGYILFFDRAKDETSLKENPNASGVGGRGPLANNIGPERVEAIRAQLGLKAGDAAFFVAGDPEKFAKFAGMARTRVGEELNLVDKERFELAWVVDFPMYEYNEDEKRIDFGHNPFSMPQGGLEALQTQDPLKIKAFQYDITCNGFEIASGGIRNHKPEAMVKAFEIAGYGEETVVERFGGMYRAFQYGAPPHGGMAAGVDRIIMLLAGEHNLREVALFPMNQRAEDILMGAPAPATPKQLRELHLRVFDAEK